MKKVVSILSLCLTAQITIHAQTNWSLTGNSGTNAATNFVGTKDNISLAFRTNNAIRMQISNAGNIGIGTTTPLQKLDVNGNINLGKGFGLFIDNHQVLKIDSIFTATYVGAGAGAGSFDPNFLVGDNNTGVGYQSLFSNKSGFQNTGNGSQSLFSNTFGNYNTANGFKSLFSNSTGLFNTASGAQSLYLNTIGERNTATGYAALYSNTTASYNSAFGWGALMLNSEGANNTASGYQALYLNSIGTFNTANGSTALMSNTTGSYNSASGYQSLYSNNTGTANTANGVNTLLSNTTGSWNTAIGTDAHQYNATGNFNTAVGFAALYNTPYSSSNTAIGAYAGFNYANGWNNTFIGEGADAGTSDIYNGIAIGNFAYVYAPNQVRIGNSSTTSIGGYANWTNISDGRVKKNIKDNVPGLAFINKLKPVTYNLNLDAADRITKIGSRKDKDGKIIEPTQQEINARKAKEQILYSGFIAQDVEKAAKELNYDFSGVDAAKNDKDLYGLRYAEFVVPLVKAVQELSKQNDELKSEVEELKKAVSGQASGISNQSTVNGQQSTASSTLPFRGWGLEQNIPNPFNSSTSIDCFIPVNNGNAFINFYNQSGTLVKSVKVTNNGKNTITLNANELAAGTYKYALVVDGVIADSKTMVLQR